MFHVDNLERDIKDIKDQLIEECIKSTEKRIKGCFNYEVFSKYHDKLYYLFINSCKKYFKNIKPHDTPRKLWSYYTDKNFPGAYLWHNHKRTCNLCGVLYLKTVKGCGIELRHNNDIVDFEPKNYDLLIFPGFLDHRPLMSLIETRISLQFEIMCDM